MKELFLLLHTILLAGRDAVLATVVERAGSSPCVPGARMLVDASGRREGTVGGGSVEHRAEQTAKAVLTTGKNRLETYTLRHGEAGEIGMICGGEASIYFSFLPASAADFALQAARCFERDESVWLLADITPDTGGAMALCSAAGMADTFGGRGAWGALGKGDVSRLLASAPLCHETEGQTFYSEPLVRAGRAVIFGGGHVAQALAPLLAGAGFRVVVFDDRPEFAAPALFPGAAEVLLGDFSNIGAHLKLTADDWLVILTRGHAADFEVQRQVLRRRYAYVGVIGSRSKIAAVSARLRAAGIAQQAIDTVYTPIGLDIGAVTPAEIAVAIAAELIAVRAAHPTAAHLSGKRSPP